MIKHIHDFVDINRVSVRVFYALKEFLYFINRQSTGIDAVQSDKNLVLVHAVPFAAKSAKRLLQTVLPTFCMLDCISDL